MIILKLTNGDQISIERGVFAQFTTHKKSIQSEEYMDVVEIRDGKTFYEGNIISVFRADQVMGFEIDNTKDEKEEE